MMARDSELGRVESSQWRAGIWLGKPNRCSNRQSCQPHTCEISPTTTSRVHQATPQTPYHNSVGKRRHAKETKKTTATTESSFVGAFNFKRKLALLQPNTRPGIKLQKGQQ